MSEFLQPPSDPDGTWTDDVNAYRRYQAERSCKEKASQWNRDDDSGAHIEYLDTYPDKDRYGKWWCVFQTHIPQEDD